MINELTYSEVEKMDNYLLVDVRSESEYQEATIPEAINVPLFNDEERAHVGTVYKNQGAEKARELGVQIVSPKLPLLIQKIRNALKADQHPIFFCWRGGMRSKSMAIFYDLVYPKVYRLQGGYRGYRNYILEQMSTLTLPMPIFVLHGMTGVGKTMLLHKLEKKGVGIIDLEALAGHRGSVFGSVGEVLPANQKTFDSRLYNVLTKIKSTNALVIEAESKRIGKIIVPDPIMDSKENGHHIWVDTSIDIRIERIIMEYEPHKNTNEIYDSFSKIDKRFPTEIRVDIHTAIKEQDFYTVTKLLLNYYYDSRYQHSTDQFPKDFYKVDSTDLDKATKQIFNYIQMIIESKPIPNVVV